MLPMRFLLALLAIFSIVFEGFTQVNYQSYYEQGKNQLANKQYNEARQSLIMAMADNPQNAYTIPATYLYIMAAYKGGDLVTAYQNAKILVDKVRTASIPLDQKQEILYLAATIAFEKDQALQAMLWLDEIKGSALRKPITDLKKYFLTQKSKAEVELIFRKYNKDRVVAEILADKIANQETLTQNELQQLKNIELQFGYTSPYQKKSTTLTNVVAQKKEVYHIAVMFPFRTTDESAVREVQLFLDMYEGMKIAAQDLASEGVRINLLPFDTENDASKVKELVSLAAMKNVDMFVGPLYPTTFPIVADFAQKNAIPMLNPLSSNPEIIEGKTDIYLFEPSYKTQAKKVADYALDSLRRKNAYILYGTSSKDLLMAQAYKLYIEAKGGTVRVFKQIAIDKNTYKNITNALVDIAPKPKRPKAGETFEKPEADTTSHIFVASSELAIAGTVISTLKTSMVDIPLFVDKSWLSFEQLDMNDFMERSVYFIYTDYVSSLKSEDFVSKYIAQTNVLPSDYAYIGYESMYLFGKILYEYGTNFSPSLQRSRFREGKIMIGHDYFQANDNQFVPIVRFVENKLEIVNSFLYQE